MSTYVLLAAVYLVVAGVVAWLATRLGRWLLAVVVAAIGIAVFGPVRCTSLPMLLCRLGVDCVMSGTTCWTLVGLKVPGADAMGYLGTWVMAFAIVLGAVALSWLLATYGRR